MEGRVWIPPYDFAMNPTADKWALIIFGAIAFLVLVYSVVYSWKIKDMLPIYVFIGATISTGVEPFIDVMGLSLATEVGSTPGYQCIGRTLPFYYYFLYMLYLTPTILFLLYRCQKGMTTSWLMKFYLIVVVCSASAEIIAMPYNLWTYYGNQGFVFNINGYLKFGWPVFFGFANLGAVVLTGIAIFKALPYLPGWKKIAVIPLMPVFMIAAWSGCAFYSSTALNKFQGLGATRVATIVTALISLLVVWLAGRIVAEKPVTE